MVKLFEVPAHSLVEAVTVIDPPMAKALSSVAVKDGMLSTPLAARPMLVSVFVQVNVLPDTGPVKVMPATGNPLHIVWLSEAFTLGVGFTVIAKLLTGPAQPLAMGRNHYNSCDRYEHP